MKITDLQKDTLHHAYLINGDSIRFAELQRSLASLFELGDDFAGNPDVYIRQFDSLGVSDARELVSFASRSAFMSGASKIVIIAFSTITNEAQNALLKTLEEPSKATYIFLLTPSVDMMLPTVLSRCMQVEFDNGQRGSLTTSDDAEEFIKASVSDRLKIVAKLVKKDKDKKVDKTKLLELLSGIEVYLANNKKLQNRAKKIEVVLQAKKYLHSKGAMSKMLMESVALVV